MPFPQLIIIISWAVFLLYWTISSLNVKKDVKGSASWYWSGRGLVIRFVVLFLILFVISYEGNRFHSIEQVTTLYNPSHGSLPLSIGALCVVLGIAFAIWARIHLGRNWSSHPSLKEGHELVTSGPYTFVRHPIYTGVLLAVLGSGIAGGIWWLIPFLLFIVIFVKRVHKEEAIMTQTFPDQYLEYKKHTWALIPYVW